MQQLPHQLFIEKLDKTTTLEDVGSVCEQMCEHYGFDHFFYIGQIPSSFVEPEYIYINGYPPGWLQRYKKNQYMSKDPLVSHCANHITPIEWSNIQARVVRDDAGVRLLREARSYGLCNGVSIPVHSHGGDAAILSFTLKKDDRYASSTVSSSTPDLYLLSAYTHQAAMRIYQGPKDTKYKKHDLTEREKECLLWVAEGETTWDIANRIGIAESTVIFHIQNSMKKLSAANRQQAIAKAVMLGIILPRFR